MFIKNVDDLNKARELAKIEMEAKPIEVRVCGDTACTSSGSRELVVELRKMVEEYGIADKVNVVQTGCFGLCALGPIIIVYPGKYFYANVKKEMLKDIVEKHLIGGEPVKEYLYKDTVKLDGFIDYNQTPFYSKQTRIVLHNCGVIAPDKIDHYIAMNGYQALAKALFSMTPDEVIDCLNKSGLRGRGGAGFPTGRKWTFTKAAVGDEKFVCCNADEGDPGAFMDRSVLEGDPHAVLEAMAIAGYTIGSKQGYIYVRAEYPSAIDHLNTAIAQAHEYGLLGKNIMGSGFDFDIELRLGSGAFVCGEETALMTSIEGHRGEPRPRPPFPANKGLFSKPTLLNNVETYANITQIILNGGEWFASMGTEKSHGTKVFALAGKINYTGLVEVPMGTTIREVIYDIGGGIPNGKKFKAIQSGGPSGGCIPESLIDTPIDYDNLIAVGAMMGSGGLIVMDEDTCMVDIARFFLDFTCDESCGKCAPCRIGTKRLLETLDKIIAGKGELEDIDKLEALCYHLKANSLCALGQTAPNPVLSTLKFFRDEYIAHVVDKRCPAGVCKSLVQFVIDKDKCIGCGLCAKNCPADAISRTDYVAPGHKLASMAIDTSKCVKCGTCVDNCKFKAISKK